MDPSHAHTPIVPPREGDLHRAIEDGFQRAREAHGDLALPLDEFSADVLDLLARSRRRLGLPADAAGLHEDAAGLHFEDLYLARLCERGDAKAWSDFVARYQPDLLSVLRRNWTASEAEGVAAEVLSEVSLAPPDGCSRTRLGTYDGTGPLWAWLATIGFRTARRRWRKRREEVALEVAGEQAAPPDESEVDLDDQVETFMRTLRRGWAQLGPRERLAIGWKHRDGLAQRTIAELLGISEPTVSRLVTRGIQKLKGTLSAIAQEAGTPDPALWTRLEQALTGFLERNGPLQPPETE